MTVIWVRKLKTMNKKKTNLFSFNNLYFAYSFTYVIFAIAIFIAFLLKEKTFVWLNDGIAQNVIELKSSAEFFKYLFSEDVHYLNYNLIENNIIFRFFYWGIRNILSLLVMDNQYLSLYLFYYILQTYTSGIFFILFCKNKEELKDCNINGILIGTIIYVFTGYSFYTMLQVEFGYVMVAMPILFMLIDRIINKNKGFIFSIAIAITVLFHVPYFYPLTLIMGIYIFFSVIEKIPENDRGRSIVYCIKKIFFVIKWWLLGL